MTPRQIALLAGVSAIWGASYLLIKIALDGFEPMPIVFSRVALAALVLYAVVVLRSRDQRRALRDVLVRTPGRAALLGLLTVALPFSLISLGETQIGSGLTGILVSPGPLFVAMLAPFVDASERVGGKAALGMVIGFAGVVVLIGVDAVTNFAEFAGAIAVLAAAASYGAGALYAKLKLADVPALVVSCVACVSASLWTLVPAALTLPGSHPDMGEVAAVTSLGLFGTAIAFVIYYSLIAETGAGRASLVGYLIPPIALAYGALLLGERITLASIAGLVMILAGVVMAGGEREIEGQPAPEP